MRSAIAHAAHRRAERRQRANSLSTVPPAQTDGDYNQDLAAVAASILYRSPLPSKTGRPVYILNAAAFPDAFEIDYDSLLSYVLARLPGEDELLSGTEYEIVFFAGGQPEGATTEKKQGPGMGWYLQAYHVLSRATRKKLQRLYIVHPRTWVRVLVGVFGTVVSPKFRRKIIHVNTLSQLAMHIQMEKLLIPPSVYLHDRKLSPDIYVPYVTGKRAFGVKHPFPKSLETGKSRLPRVLRETTSFVLMQPNIKTEGLFRIPPHSTLAGALKEAYDRGQYFIIWKEKEATLVQPGIDPALVVEVRLEDAYGVHLAASLIKQWYRDLKEPIFPESCYDALKDKYGSPDAEIRPEDLVDLILPQSEASPLTKKSRKILTRHLLPMLTEVAAHESENKMNAENLAICFSMCMVCGSDQLEDAKISSIVKRLLQASIEAWSELSIGMDISADKFFEDLQAPANMRDYEDPLEEEKPQPRPPRLSEDDAVEGREGHRIVLEDAEDAPLQPRPMLPPRPENGDMPKKAPTLPPRPSAPSTTSASPITPGSGSEPTSAIPKRKPAPPILDPPRYSTVFDADGNSLNVADSPSSYAPADGFGPPRRGPWSYDETEKKGFPPPEFEAPSDPHPALNPPKRKAFTNEEKAADAADTSDTSATANVRSASEGGMLARLAAQRAAAGLAQQVAAANASHADAGEVVQSPDSIAVQSAESVLSEGDGVFRKPTWPASARPQALAKPMLPPRQSQTVPIISAPANSSNGLAPSNMPRPRAPSPGLLKRMSSMEVSNDAASQSRNALEPRRLDLKKTSVEDLRRLYEERVNTAQGLAKADAARKNST